MNAIHIPLLGKDFARYFDAKKAADKAFELLKGMHEPLSLDDWILEYDDDHWRLGLAGRRVLRSVGASAFHPYVIYIYPRNRGVFND